MITCSPAWFLIASPFNLIQMCFNINFPNRVAFDNVIAFDNVSIVK